MLPARFTFNVAIYTPLPLRITARTVGYVYITFYPTVAGCARLPTPVYAPAHAVTVGCLHVALPVTRAVQLQLFLYALRVPVTHPHILRVGLHTHCTFTVDLFYYARWLV